MVEVEVKSSVENSDAEAAASDLVKLNVEVPAAVSEGEEKGEQNKIEENHNAAGENSMQVNASGSEPENKDSSKNDNAELTAPEPVKLNVDVSVSGGEEKKEEKNKENVGNAMGENSKKRKRKKVVKPKKKASVNSAVVETAAPEVAKMNVEVPVSVSGEEGKKEADKTEEQNTKNNPSTAGKNSKKRKRKKAALGSAKQVPAKDGDKPETSTKDKDAKKSDSMGMIFMCSSKTKQDCYRYKILGLPAAKKDLVAKIYKGMRLFLFDIDLKMLYGIYKAAAPGGYNIEPKAFNSAFPSQVRFSIMEDCLPLAEEKFKAVIKDNYYGKNKFDCQLKAEQVKNLCKLFKAAAKGQESKKAGRVRKTEAAPSFTDRSREKRPVGIRERRPGGDRERRQGRDRERRQGREQDRRDGRDRSRRQDRDRARRPAFGGDRISSAADVIYQRDAFAPVLLPSRLPPALPYTYERPLEADYYRRDAQLERHERRVLDLELSRREEVAYRDPLPYNEPLYTRAPQPAHEQSVSYLDPIYSRIPPPAQEALHSYHEPVYSRDPVPPYHSLPSLYRY